jgi:hypothetical protein
MFFGAQLTTHDASSHRASEKIFRGGQNFWKNVLH